MTTIGSVQNDERRTREGSAAKVNSTPFAGMTQIRFEGLRLPALSALSRSPVVLELSGRAYHVCHDPAMAEHPNVARVLAAAARQGTQLEIRRFPAGTRTAVDAATAVGCEVADIVKSLVFIADGRPLLALVSGADRVDLAALGGILGASEVQRATGDEARDATGVAIGGIPPFGHVADLPVLMDEHLLQRSTVWAAAGLPDTVFSIGPHELARLAGATIAAITERVMVDPAGA